jgi:hypothetical protein
MADTLFESVQTISILIHISKQYCDKYLSLIIRRQTFLLPPLFFRVPGDPYLIRKDTVIALKYGDT